MRGRLPFAVVGSNTMVMDREGNMCRGREYPWGTVNIEDKVGLFEKLLWLQIYIRISCRVSLIDLMYPVLVEVTLCNFLENISE